MIVVPTAMNTVIAYILGLTLGVVSPSMYAMAVFMAVGTTMVAPPLLNWAFRGAEARVSDADLPTIG